MTNLFRINLWQSIIISLLLECPNNYLADLRILHTFRHILLGTPRNNEHSYIAYG
jgi:hypothetical protein